MDLTSREATPDDFDAVYRSAYSTFGYGNEHREDVRKEMNVLWSNPFTISVVVEDGDRAECERVVGYAEGVFLSDAFVSEVLCAREPYVNKRIAAVGRVGPPALLDMRGVCAANGGNGLNLYIAHLGWTEPPLTAEESKEVRDRLTMKLLDGIRGYNLKRIVSEVVGQVGVARARETGFRIVTDYAEYYCTVKPPPKHLHPYLVALTREEAADLDGSVVALAFSHTTPVFRFTTKEQDVLRLAMDFRTDAEMVDALGITTAGVRARWNDIYDKVERIRPILLPQSQGASRGDQKKTRLLRYLSEHPEELRPVVMPGRKTRQCA